MGINRDKYWDLVGYKPTEPQQAVHNSSARFRVDIKGRRCGKSLSGAKELEFELFVPNTRHWIVAPTYETGDKIAREVSKQLFGKLGLGYKYKKEIFGALRYLKLENDTELWIKSADEPKGLVGEGLDSMWIDEAAQIHRLIWERDLRPTLSDRMGRATFKTTPRGYNWIYDLYKRGKSDEYPEWESWRHPSWLSPYFKDNIEDLKRELTTETFLQEYGAEFTTYAGKVFPFNREVHAAYVLPYIREWETYISIDFGYRMPSVGWYQVGTVDGRPEIHLIDEISHEENVTTESLINRIKQKNESCGYHIQKYFGDPGGTGVQSQSGIGDIERFAKAGINVIYDTDPAHRNVAARVDYTRKFFEAADRHISLYVSKTCEGHIMDFEGYQYPEKKINQNIKEEPFKDGLFDHGCDELGYFIINRFPIVKREFIEIESSEI